MRWIQAFLPLVVLHIGLALGTAEAAGPGPRRIDSASADAGCGVVHHGPLGIDSHWESLPSFDLADPIDCLTPSHPVLATSPDARPWPSLGSLILALPFPIQNPPVAVIGRHHGPSGWPVTSAVRLAWLRRFLF
jgi:hypothetical protein